MSIKETILKQLGSTKNVIKVNPSTTKLTKNIYTKLSPLAGFTPSKFHPKKNLQMIINDSEMYLILEGYVTCRRYIETKEIKPTGFFAKIFNRESKFISDEKDIIKQLDDEQIHYKKDFDDKKSCAFYYYWMPTNFLVSSESHEELTHLEFKQIHQKFLKYKTKVKKNIIKAKEQKLRKKAEDIANGKTI
ncbi:MAG: hypothetical protein WC979_01870 [Candidatus Pacearchaeota archaeon]|jgi:hypothetical protein|nr:hypothetical protein [Clostridia bacterium]